MCRIPEEYFMGVGANPTRPKATCNVAAGLGGYIAGRLRTRWIGTHTHEVFFRDTAHGLVTWALATVVVVSVLGSYVSSLIGGGFHAATTVAAGGVESITQRSMSPAANYGLDKLFRL